MILFNIAIFICITRSQTYVDDSTTCSTCDGTPENPYKTLQEGLNDMRGSTLHIAEGTYTGPGNVNLTQQNAYSNIYGAGSNLTVIDCEHAGHFQGWHLESGTFTIEGLSVRNCHAINRSINYNGVVYGGIWGGGLWIASTSTNIRDVIIEGGGADNGGGIAIFSNSIFMENSIIRNNKADNGGGIFIQKAYLRLTNVTIEGNEATSNGGGIYGINGGDTELFGTSLISDNSADGKGQQIACVNGSQFWVKSTDAGIVGNVHCDNCIIGTSWQDNHCTDHNNAVMQGCYLSVFAVVFGILSLV